MSETRHKRVESLLKEELSRIISTGRIKDPRLQRIFSVTEVSATKDLKDAKVYVSVLTTGESGSGDLSPGPGVVEALNHAAGYVQKLVGQAVRLRNTPRLKFFLDDSIRRGVDLTHKLEDLTP